MGFFEDAKKTLDEAAGWLEQEHVSDAEKHEAEALADQVLEAAETMGGSILGDIDDQLINKAKAIKQKLGK